MKICFFGYISCAIKGQTIGGGELQVYLLAKALALKGHDVVIIDPYATEDMITPEGIRLMTVPGWNKGVKGLRWIFNRIPSLYKTFKNERADFYYVRMRSFIHLVPFLVAKKTRAKFIQSIASDIDVLSVKEKYRYEYKYQTLSSFITETLPNDIAFSYLKRNANYVTLQHTGQQFTSSNPRSEHVVFSNIIDVENLPNPVTNSSDYYIYAGSLTMLKGADNLLALINILDPSVKILIVGLPKGKKCKAIYKELATKPNVELLGRKEHKETIELISKSKGLINTSHYEGFPNIYLEAWGTSVPVISLNVNPGKLFDHYSLGICCKGDLNKMKRAIEEDAAANFDKSELIRYVQNNHDLTTAADRFLSALSSSTTVTIQKKFSQVLD